MIEHPPYAIGIGHDQPVGSMSNLDPQPKGGVVMAVERELGISGSHHEQAHYVCHHYDMIESADEYQDVLIKYGLISNDTSEVTINAWSQTLFWRRYNGIAHRPEAGKDMRWENFFLREIRIYITDLELIP